MPFAVEIDAFGIGAQMAARGAIGIAVGHQMQAAFPQQSPRDRIGGVGQAFERAFELTRAYAGSANAQASAIPFVFEKLFELFVTGRAKS